MSGENQES